MSQLPCEIIETGENVDAAIIWLHGLGADGHDFVPMVPELSLSAHYKIRFIFPHAPSIPVTISGSMMMPAWYDIFDLSLERNINYDQILASADAVKQLVDNEVAKGVDSRRIILAGFSQGGAVVYHAALQYEKPLGGLMTLSTYFPTYDRVQLNLANKDLPVHIFHGTLDPVVPEALGVMAKERLQALGVKVEYKTYPIQHGVHPDEVRDISQWIRAQLPS